MGVKVPHVRSIELLQAVTLQRRGGNPHMSTVV